MSCEHYEEAVSELVDGELPEERRPDVEAHLAGCASCRALAADLTRLRTDASRLPVQQPPAHIWTKLAAELQASGHVTAGGETRASGWRRAVHAVFAGPRMRLAWAGGLTLALAVVLLVIMLPRRDTTPASRGGTNARTASPAPVHANDQELVQSVESELRLAEEHYEKAIAGLEQIANAGQGALDPQVALTLRENLAVIDRAIADSREAIKQQPTNELAQQSLFEAFRRKVGLLQDTVALINEMRKGNPDAAAKIIGNLNKT